MGTLLPPSVAMWLAAQETEMRTGLPVFPAVPKPTAEVAPAITAALKSLSELLEPAGKRRPDLALVIGKLFAAFNLYTGDAGKSAAQVEAWAEQLHEFPLYAIRKAYTWAVRSESKMPSLADFLNDVRLAVGNGVLSRKRLLQILSTYPQKGA